MKVDFQRDVFCLLGLPFDAVDMAEAVQRVKDAAAQRIPCFISTPNLNFLINCLGDDRFRSSVIDSDLSIVDGMPLVWIARLMDIPIRTRVAGSDLFEQLRKESGAPLKVYLFGGMAGVAEMACRRLNAESAGVVCVGHEYPGFGSVEEMSGDATIARINASGADFLLVALGASKGQAWIVHNRARISVPVVSHLGAVLNFIAGSVIRAPKWMQDCGLEWLWRIKEEPALWRRYVNDGRRLLGLFVTRILPHAIYIRDNWPSAEQMASARWEVAEEEHSYAVRLWGPWTHVNLSPLRLVLSAAARVAKDVRVEMGGVTFISSSFLGLLILLSAHQKQHGRQLKLTSVPKPIQLLVKYNCAEYLFDNTELHDSGHRARILNAHFDPLTLLQTVEAIFDLLKAGRRGWLCTVNVSILMMMRRDRCLQNFVDRAVIVVADGQPLIWCASWFGGFLPERVAGVDLIEAICARAAHEGKRVFFLGSRETIIRAAAQRMRERYANLQVECAGGYFPIDQAAAQADRIRASGADILFVGIGVPRQENFIDEQWDRLGVGMAIGVGGSFDVIAGLRLRAPVWMQQSGLEWIFRAIQEPRRLFPRYIVTNSKMILLVLRELLTRPLRTKKQGRQRYPQ